VFDFIKTLWIAGGANRLTVIACALLIGTATVGTIYGIVVRPGDVSFMQRDGHELQWDKVDMPIACYFEADLPALHRQTTLRVIASLNNAVGPKLFGPCFDWQIGVPLKTPDGSVWLKIRTERKEHAGATTTHRYDKRTGRILSAQVALDSQLNAEDLEKVMLHELGHVLGLDHDREKGSIMYESLTRRSSQLSSRDLKALKETY